MRLLAIRKKLQDHFGLKYANARGLFAALDIDKDGVVRATVQSAASPSCSYAALLTQISKADFMKGVKMQRFPVDDDECHEMFNAIDANRDGGTKAWPTLPRHSLAHSLLEAAFFAETTLTQCCSTMKLSRCSNQRAWLPLAS